MKETQRKFVLYDVVMKDITLTLKAKMMIIYMASKPPGSLFSTADFLDKSVDGNSSIKTGFYELEDTGYIIKSTIKGPTRKFNYFVNQDMITKS